MLSNLRDTQSLYSFIHNFEHIKSRKRKKLCYYEHIMQRVDTNQPIQPFTVRFLSTFYYYN